jgi:hypothetical protein
VRGRDGSELLTVIKLVLTDGHLRETIRGCLICRRGGAAPGVLTAEWPVETIVKLPYWTVLLRQDVVSAAAQ